MSDSDQTRRRGGLPGIPVSGEPVARSSEERATRLPPLPPTRDTLPPPPPAKGAPPKPLGGVSLPPSPAPSQGSQGLPSIAPNSSAATAVSLPTQATAPVIPAALPTQPESPAPQAAPASQVESTAPVTPADSGEGELSYSGPLFDRVHVEEVGNSAPEIRRSARRTESDNAFMTPPRHQPSRNSGRGRGGKRKRSKVDQGGKPRAALIRSGVAIAIILLAGYGVKNIIIPPKFPSPEQVISAVQQGLEISDFPAERGNAFVTSFVEEYLTIDPEDTNRSSRLGNFAPPEIMSKLRVQTGDETQKIVRGPYISGVRYASDEDAVYTVASQVGGGKWIYLDVPVFYNSENRAFAISGTPAFVSSPRLSAIPPYQNEWEEERDTPAGLDRELTGFFRAWAHPTRENLDRYYSEPDARVVAGINGVAFGSLSNLKVSVPLDEENPNSLRVVQVQVVWFSTNGISASSDNFEKEAASFASDYELLVYPDGDKWYVQDIRGGVRSTSGAVGGEDDVIESE